MPNINKRTKWDDPVWGEIRRKRQSLVMKKARPWLKSSRNSNNNRRSKFNALKHGKYSNPWKSLGKEFEECKGLMKEFRKALEDGMTIYKLQGKEDLSESDIKKVENLCEEYM